jgi:gas vesicle protein
MNDKEMTTIKKTKKLFISFLLGGAIGSTIALLFAPKSGKLLRNDISRKTNELIEEGKVKTDHLWNNAKEEVGSSLDSANDFLSASKVNIMNKAGKVKDAFKAGVSAYNEKRKSGGDEKITSMENDETTNNEKTNNQIT